MTTNYNLYEVSFAQNYSICIKSIFDNAEDPKYNEELFEFLAEDIKKFGEIIDIMPITVEEAEKFFDLSDFDNWPVFGYKSKLNDPWFVYEIGDTYRNNNGDDYIIIAMDKDSDKMILAKKSKLGDKNITLFIGAKGIGMHHWNFGHYFMQNFEAACDWFNKVEENEGDIIVKDLMDKFMGPVDATIFVCNTNDYRYYRFLDTSIPHVLSDCKIKAIMVKTFYVSAIDDDNTGLTLYIDFEANEINNERFHQDYASYEV